MSARRGVPTVIPAAASAGVVDVLTGAQPLVPPLPAGLMTPETARVLTARIRAVALEIGDRLARLRQLVEQARDGEAWSVLGYTSWPAYLSDVLEPMRLPRDERREVVGYLTGEGMSSRAIATVVSADHKTVVNDRRALAAVAAPPAGGEVSPPAQPEPIVGLDGKAYSVTQRPRLVVVPPVVDATQAARRELAAPPRGGLTPFVEYLRTRIATTGQATAEDWERAVAAAERYAVSAR